MRPVAALEPPKYQICCLLGGVGPAAAASARADALIVHTYNLFDIATPTSCRVYSTALALYVHCTGYGTRPYRVLYVRNAYASTRPNQSLFIP